MCNTRSYYDRAAGELERKKVACDLDREETESILGSMPHDAGSLLDVGCGTGHLLERAACARRIGVDFSISMLRLARGRRSELVLVLADGRRLPFKPATFAAVTCQDAMGHLEDPSAMVREMLRCIAPRGNVVVTVVKTSIKSRLLSAYCRLAMGVYVRSFTKEGLEKIFEASGGRVLKDEAIGGSTIKLVACPRE